MAQTKSCLTFIALLWIASPCTAQMGHVLDAVGPTNQSMGGAGTALPLDAMGALQWNPASITGLRRSEVGFSFAAFGPETSIESSVEAGAFGPGVPGGRLQGSTKSDVGISPIPAFAATTGRSDSPWAYGLGAFAIGGFGVDYPVSSQNPILTPQPPGGFGFGAIYSQFQLMQFCPTVARRFESGWSVGFAPTFNWATLAIDPFSAASPNADGRYASAAHGDSAWGVGCQAGLFYEPAEPGWNFGVSYKSPQWFQDFKMNGWDATGGARQLRMDLDYPSILSIGVAFTGFRRLQIATDVRYIDYENTDGFQSAGFDGTGAVTGFGWASIWTVSNGIAIDVNERLQWRAGYTYNQSPIDSATVFYNSPAPAIIQHHLSTGFTREFSDGWMCSLAYKHGFRNTVSGSWWGPAGNVPGTRIASILATHNLSVGLTKRF